MSLYRNDISPTRQPFPSSPFPPPLIQPLGYVVESSSTNRRREINTLKDLRRETRANTTYEKLFVVHNHDARVLEALDIDALIKRKKRRGRAVGEWIWEYPDTYSEGPLRFFSVSLYRRGERWVLLVDSPPLERGSRQPPPRLKHQDAATRMSALRTASPFVNAQEKNLMLDEELCNAFGGEESLEEVLGELVFDRWLSFLDCLSDKDCSWRKEGILYQALQSLERNQDFIRHLTKYSQPLTTPSHQDTADLLTRLHRHVMHLPQPSSSTSSSSSSINSFDRSLNRITYLGGLLLPITVVSSVLAIEGDYGPEGNNFWVFWVAAAVASVVAVGLIHMDEVRGVEVWKEVAEEFGILGGDEGEGGKGSVRDGHGLVWEKRQLGWGGAVKKVSGYYRIRGAKGLKFERPDGR